VKVRPRLRRAWQACAYLMVGAATALLAWVLTSGLIFAVGLVLVVVGLPLLPDAVLVLRRFASMERRRAGRVLGEPIPERYVPSTRTPTGMRYGC
jgi:hypothetical protein